MHVTRARPVRSPVVGERGYGERDEHKRAWQRGRTGGVVAEGDVSVGAWQRGRTGGGVAEEVVTKLA